MIKDKKAALANLLSQMLEEEASVEIKEVITGNLPAIRQLIDSRRSNIDRIAESIMSTGVAGTKKQIKAFINEALGSEVEGKSASDEFSPVKNQDPTNDLPSSNSTGATADLSSSRLEPLPVTTQTSGRPPRANRRPPELDSKATTIN
jgi:hypothetical protein